LRREIVDEKTLRLNLILEFGMSVPFIVSITRLALAESGISMKQYLAALPLRSNAIRTFTHSPMSAVDNQI
ncbi:hypothetical protein T4D_14800, partial [Trichinella pseudospiralis]